MGGAGPSTYAHRIGRQRVGGLIALTQSLSRSLGGSLGRRPGSRHHGDTGCGNILAGGDGWVSVPTERGGYWSAPSSSAPRASAPATPTNASSAAKTFP